jgi:hypothetical protein
MPTRKSKALKIYIAGPYTAPSDSEIQTNVNNAIDAAIMVYKKGHFPYLPHLTHWIELRSKETNQVLKWEDYLEMDRVWLEICDALLFLRESRGAKLELDYAKKMNKKIFYNLDEIPTVKREFRYQFC